MESVCQQRKGDKYMKATMAVTAIEGKDKNWTFILFQPPIKKLLKIKKFEGGVAEVVFLEEVKAQNLKIYLKMLAGCFCPRSNIGETLQRFFETQQPFKELHLILDEVTLKISKENMDVARLYKQFRQMRIGQKGKKKKEQSSEELPTNILEFRNQKLTMQKKQERRKMRERWIKAMRK